MHRFFVEPEDIKDEKEVIITGNDVRHITRSLRLRSGDKISVCNGAGQDYLVELTELDQDDDQVKGRIIESQKSKGEPEIEVTLFQGLPKKDKMDLISQKCTELGINRVIPVEMKRSIVKLNQKKAKRRINRWQKIAYEGAKQSKRGIIPEIGPLYSFKDMIQYIKDEGYDLCLIPWEESESKSIKEAIALDQTEKDQIKKVAYVIGPEGGLEEDEVESIKEVGGQSITLGPRILRTETAGLAVLAVLMYEFNQMEEV